MCAMAFAEAQVMGQMPNGMDTPPGNVRLRFAAT